MSEVDQMITPSEEIRTALDDLRSRALCFSLGVYKLRGIFNYLVVESAVAYERFCEILKYLLGVGSWYPAPCPHDVNSTRMRCTKKL